MRSMRMMSCSTAMILGEMNKKDKRAQFMTALPNQVKDTWDVNMDMTSTFTCGYGYIKWRNVTKEDELWSFGRCLYFH